MVTAPPQVRAAHLKTLLATLADGSPRDPTEGEDPLPSEVRDRIESAHRLSWLPAEDLVEVCRAAERRVGPGGLEAWGAAALKRMLQAPLFGAFYEAAMWLERRDPGVLIHYGVQAWPLLYSGCGDLLVEARGKGEVRLLHLPVPDLLRCETTLLPLLGGIAALTREAGCDVRVEADWSPNGERFVYTVRW
ncbi:MAG TPA: hypothetical protein VFE30_00210 [Anaeromyxobacteraceae bacterium]|jgi:hypothetical protein|nr:hypothetical protein [Anaeromyxobacteraceae bacterium]